MKVFVETPRTLIRELLEEDAEAMFEMDSDPQVHRYLGNEPVKNIGKIIEVIAFVRKQYSDNGIGRWAVIDKQSGKFIGCYSICRILYCDFQCICICKRSLFLLYQCKSLEAAKKRS